MGSTGTVVIDDDHVGHVRRLVEARDARWRQRLSIAQTLDEQTHDGELAILRQRVAHDAAKPAERRWSAFTPLSDRERTVLVRSVRAFEEEGRLVTLHDNPRVQSLLDILRVNYVAGAEIVSGVHFREAARAMFRSALETVWQRAALPSERDALVVVLPWRAALICGEVYRDAGVTAFWHFGAKRNEQTLATELYYESAPNATMRTCIHLVCDPMLATGNTTATTIHRMLTRGVAEDRIVVHAVIAAPEGIDALLDRYPQLVIITCALDEGLDRNGYIEGVGLGDFGDLAMRGIDADYACARWIQTGLLTPAEAEIVLRRTQPL